MDGYIALIRIVIENISKRTLLKSVPIALTVSLSGCIGSLSRTEIELLIYNHTGSDLTAEVTLERNGSVVVRQQVDLAGVEGGAASSETRPLLSGVTNGTEYDLNITAEGQGFTGETKTTSFTVTCAFRTEPSTVGIDIPPDEIQVNTDRC